MFWRNKRARALVWMVLLIGGCAAFAQQSSQNSTQPSTQDSKKKKKDSKASATTNPTAPAATTNNPPPTTAAAKPKPLFGGSLTLKSSRQSKDATTLGFNGLDPNGEVQKAVLNADPTPDDTSAAQQLAAYQINPAQLDSFIKSGNLNEQAATKEASKGKH